MRGTLLSDGCETVRSKGAPLEAADVARLSRVAVVAALSWKRRASDESRGKQVEMRERNFGASRAVTIAWHYFIEHKL